MKARLLRPRQLPNWWLRFTESNPVVPPVITLAVHSNSLSEVVPPGSVSEDGIQNHLVYTFTRSGDTSSELTVNYTVGGTDDSRDYTGIVPAGKTKTVTFAAGAATATVIVDPTSDNTVEACETVGLALAAGIGYRIGTPGPVIGTITNDDVTSSLVDVDSNLSVFSDEGVPSVSTDQRDYVPGEKVTIAASDFTPGSTISFAIADLPSDPGDDGDADVYAPWSVTDGGMGDLDGVVNGQVVTLWQVPTDDNGSGSGTPDALNATLMLTATGSDGPVAVTTFTDAGNTPTVSLEVSAVSSDGTEISFLDDDPYVLEDGTANLVYTFRRIGGDISSPLTVNYSVRGNAVNGTDYSPIGTSVTFAAGSATAIVTVDPIADTTV